MSLFRYGPLELRGKRNAFSSEESASTTTTAQAVEGEISGDPMDETGSVSKIPDIKRLAAWATHAFLLFIQRHYHIPRRKNLTAIVERSVLLQIPGKLINQRYSLVPIRFCPNPFNP
jgi:hypothetical protein